MALSGTVKGKVTQNSGTFSYYMSWSATQNKSTNESTITVKHYWTKTAGSSAAFDSVNKRRYGININGSLTEGTKRMDYNPWPSDTTISTATHTVPHEPDGTKTITISAYANGTAGSYGPSNASAESGDCTVSTTVILDPIPRAAQLLTASNFTDETNPTVTYSNPAGTIADVQMCIADTNGQTQYVPYRSLPATGTSYTFELTDDEKESLIKAVPDGTNQMYVNFYIKTYLNGALVDDLRHLTRIFEVVNSTPEISYTIKDTGAASTKLTKDSSVIIKGFNYVTASMTPTYKKYATAKAQTITNGSTTINGTSANFNNIENGNFIFYVKDSFGNEVSKPVDVTAKMIDYTKLTCNITPNTPTADGDLAVKISGKYFNNTFGSKGVQNDLKVYWHIKENDGEYEDWVSVNSNDIVKTDDNTYETTIILTGLDYRSMYKVQAMASDSINTSGVLSPERITKSTPVFNWGENNFDINVPLTVDNIGCNNIFGGGLETGSFDSNTGAKQTNANNYRNTDFVEVEPNTGYVMFVNGATQRFVILYYDSSKTFITESRSVSDNGIFATPSNAKYINFRCYQDDFVSNYSSLKIEITKASPINNLVDIIYPIGSIYHSSNNANPGVLFGGEWEQIKTYTGGELIAFGVGATNGDGTWYADKTDILFSNLLNKGFTIENYVGEILKPASGTIYVNPTDIVGMIEVVYTVSGLGEAGLRGFWFLGNYNTLPSQISMLPSSGWNALISGPVGYGYGGCSHNFMYKFNDATTEGFFINPRAQAYGGGFTPSSGGVGCSLQVKAFAKAGVTYVWRRTA